MRTWLTLAALGVMAATPALAQLAEPIPKRQSAPAPREKPLAERGAMVACPEFGPGFMRSPGSSTCVRVEGRVRGETQFRQRGSHVPDGTGSSVHTRLGLDARTVTDSGPVRAVVSVRGQAGSFEPRGAR